MNVPKKMPMYAECPVCAPHRRYGGASVRRSLRVRVMDGRFEPHVGQAGQGLCAGSGTKP